MQTSSYLLQILRCPYCIKDDTRDSDKDPGTLTLEREYWLVCKTCERKYPIRDFIPAMLIEEGEKWIKIPVAELPSPPTPEETTEK